MKLPLTLACILSLATASALRADVTPASLFTDHAVLQQGPSAPVWGTASPNEHVTVSFNGQSQSTTADANGHWMVHLANLTAGGPYDLTFSAHNTITLHDLYVGEVWLCSGQSNMDFTVARTKKYYFAGTQNEAQEVANAHYPLIRMFSGEWQKAYTPQSTIPGQWKICNPQNVREFSAIGYFFARDLQKQLNVPVGIVTMTFGASTAQSWIRREALAAHPEFHPMLEQFDKEVATFRAHPPATLPAKEPAASQTAGKKRRRSRGPHDPVQNQHNPTVMYNGMIAPMLPYAIKGILWYQGESITADTRSLFPKLNETLITDWRHLWNNPDLPFYFCQLAALKANSNSPTVREEQAQALKLPHTAMAVTIDIGDPHSVHPKDKQDVGDRLCRIALALTYGKPIEYAGPTFYSATPEGNTLRIHFTHAEGLHAKGDTLHCFTLAGPDGKFLPATATITGDSVLLSNPQVQHPTNARYAWANYPENPNLYNAANLPAPPFRTDKP